MHQKVVVAVVGALLTTVSLITAGCGLQPSAQSATDNSVSREALGRDERLCVTNNTGMTVKIVWSYEDSQDALVNDLLTAGATNCATGSNTGAYGLTVRVRWNDRLSQLFTVYNPSVGTPQVVIDSDKQSAMDVTRCGQVYGWTGVNYCSQSFEVNQSNTYGAYGWHESVLTRIGDSANYKEFTLSLNR